MTILNMVGGGTGETSENLVSHSMTPYSHNEGANGGSVSTADKDYMWETSTGGHGRIFLSEIDSIYYGSINGESSVASSTRVNWARMYQGESVRVGPVDGTALPVGTKVTGILVADNGVNSFFSVGDPEHNTIAEFTVSYISSAVGTTYSDGDLTNDTYYPVPYDWSTSEYTYILFPLRIEFPE